MSETSTISQADEDTSRASQSGLNSPELDEKTGKPTQKAINGAKQAQGIAKNLKKTAMEEGGRLVVAGEVASIYGGRPPFPQVELDRAGQGWRHNTSTGFLPSIIDRVTPQMRDPIFRAELLTHSTLPSEIDQSSRKSRKFCEVMTKTIRGWRGWNDFVSLLTQDICVYGIGSPGTIDADWRPRVFRPDQFFLFEDSDQHASKLQLAVFRESMLVHDFLDLFRNHAAAKVAKYNVEECIKAVNHTFGTKTDSTDLTPLEEQDAIREKGTMQFSSENQAKTVNLFHVFVREWDGKIALWTVTEEGGYEVRHVEDCDEEFEIAAMEDVCALFTLQVGNGKFYGSKGLGRLLANIHNAIERLRCLGFDQNYLSGLLILLLKAGDLKTMQTHVMHPFIVVQGANIEISKEQIQFNAVDWKMIDDMLTGIAESIAGAFLPPNLNTAGSANTKIEAAQKADREIAVRQGVLGRFFAQFADLIGMIQRKICSIRNLKEAVRLHEAKKATEKKGMVAMARKLFNKLARILGTKFNSEQQTAPLPDVKIADKEAVEALLELLDFGLSIEEIVKLSDAVTGNDVQSNNAERDEKTVAFIMANQMNPYYNKKEMAKMQATIAIGEDRMKQLINEDQPDPDVQAREARQQLMEFSEFMGGQYLPVAQTDNHVVHRQVLSEKAGALVGVLEKTMQSGLPMDPGILTATSHSVAHYYGHLQMDKDTDPIKLQQELGVIQSWQAVVEQAQKFAEAQAKAAEQAKAAMAARGGAPGAPPPGPNGEPANPKDTVDAAVNLRGSVQEDKKLELEERRVAIEEDKHEHQVNMDTLTAASDLAKAQQEAQQAVIEGMKDAQAQKAAEEAAKNKPNPKP